MPRNGDTYRYITAAIPRNSQVYDELVADSAASGKSLADVLVLRLADYYRGKRSSQAQIGVHPPPPALPAAAARQASPAPPPRQQEEEIKEYDPKRAKNAAAAALATMDFGDE